MDSNRKTAKSATSSNSGLIFPTIEYHRESWTGIKGSVDASDIRNSFSPTAIK
jgi:hypothetical protein